MSKYVLSTNILILLLELIIPFIKYIYLLLVYISNISFNLIILIPIYYSNISNTYTNRYEIDTQNLYLTITDFILL